MATSFASGQRIARSIGGKQRPIFDAETRRRGEKQRRKVRWNSIDIGVFDFSISVLRSPPLLLFSPRLRASASKKATANSGSPSVTHRFAGPALLFPRREEFHQDHEDRKRQSHQRDGGQQPLARGELHLETGVPQKALREKLAADHHVP